MSVAKSINELFKAATVGNITAFCPVLGVDSSGQLLKAFNMIGTPNCTICKDADTAILGFMKTSGSTAHLPMSGHGGFVFTIGFDTVAKIQIFFCWGYDKVFIRRHSSGSGNDKWEGWHQFAFVTS